MKYSSDIPEAYSRQLSMLNYAMISGIVLFGAVSVFIDGTYEDDPGPAFTQTMIMLCVAGLVIGISTGIWLFRKRITTIRVGTTSATMLAEYRLAFLMRTALIEGPALLCLIAQLVTNEKYFLAGAAVAVVVMVSFHPTQQRIARDLGLES